MAKNQIPPELKDLEARLTKLYRDSKKDLTKDWNRYLMSSKKVADDLKREYEAAKKAGDKAEIKKTGKAYGQYLREQTLTNERYNAMLDVTLEKMCAVNETALAYINGTMPATYVRAYKILSTELEAVRGYSFSLADEHTVRALITKNPDMLPRKTMNKKKDMAWNKKAINSQVTQGIVNGESIDRIAGRLMNVTAMNEKAAIRNARTMTTSCENLGRLDSYKEAEEKGLILKKVWMAAIDDKTRESHALLDGEEQDIDEPFSNGLMYPGDPDGEPEEVYNCRCTMVTHFLGFKD